MDDWGWRIREKLLNTSKMIKITRNLKTSFNSYLSKSRLSICTYPATTYNELIGNNIPMICFWDRRKWLLEKNAENMIDKLKDANIYFEDPILASEFIYTIWDNVDDWWYDKKTQSAIEIFSQHYAEKCKNINHISHEIIKIKSK